MNITMHHMGHGHWPVYAYTFIHIHKYLAIFYQLNKKIVPSICMQLMIYIFWRYEITIIIWSLWTMYQLMLVRRKFWVLSCQWMAVIWFLSYMVLFGESLNPFVRGLIPVNVLSTFKMDADIHEFSKEIFDWWTLWIGTIILSLILRIQRLKIHVGVYDVRIWKIRNSILNLETRCSNSAASLVQGWAQTCCSFSAISSEDQVC